MNALAVSVSIRSVPSKENRSTLARFARWMVRIWGERKGGAWWISEGGFNSLGTQRAAWSQGGHEEVRRRGYGMA